jgi:hypothetical protein
MVHLHIKYQELLLYLVKIFLRVTLVQ